MQILHNLRGMTIVVGLRVNELSQRADVLVLEVTAKEISD